MKTWVSKKYTPGYKMGTLTIVSTHKIKEDSRVKYYALCDCDCGKKNHKVHISSFNKVKSCGCQNPSGERHYYYKGVMYNNGYKLIKCTDPNHPHQYRGGYVYEHRYVMEQHIGRYLDPKEKVHHRDFNKLNNNINNLFLCTNDSEHHKLFHNDINLHRRIHGPICPRCESGNTHSNGKSWQCRNCNRQFIKNGNVRRKHPACPRCNSADVVSRGKDAYKCRSCRRHWSVKT